MLGLEQVVELIHKRMMYVYRKKVSMEPYTHDAHTQSKAWNDAQVYAHYHGEYHGVRTLLDAIETGNMDLLKTDDYK